MSNLLERADSDVHVAESLLGPIGNPTNNYLITNVAAFHAQQAIEKALKYKIQAVGIPPIDTHNLTELLHALEHNGIVFSPVLKTQAFVISSWENDYQFNDDFHAVKSDVEYAIQLYKELRKQI